VASGSPHVNEPPQIKHRSSTQDKAELLVAEARRYSWKPQAGVVRHGILPSVNCLFLVPQSANLGSVR